MDEVNWVWGFLRWYAAVCILLISWLNWRRMRYQVETGQVTKAQDVEYKVTMSLMIAFFGVLFIRSAIVGTPGGFHLYIAAAFVSWPLKPLFAGEWQRRRAVQSDTTRIPLPQPPESKEES